MNHRKYHHPRTFADFYAEFLIRLTECRTCKDAYFRTEQSSVQEYNRPKFVEAFNDSRCTAYYVPTNIANEIDGVASKDFYPDFVGEKAAYANLLGEYNFRYTMYGDTDVTAGQVMAIRVPRAQDQDMGSIKKNSNDKMFTGTFLMSRIEHIITFNSNVDYYMRISGVNGARDYSVEGARDE